jgi:hypothetical protein
MSSHLDHLHTSLLTGKLPRNLTWSDTVDLMGMIGQIHPHGNDEFVFTVGASRAFFKNPHTHELSVEEVARLRKFLREAGPAKSALKPIQPCKMIVVVDHHGAHIYQDVEKTVPEFEHAVRPTDPSGFHRHLIHRKEAHYRGDRVPEEKSFYEDIARNLVPADEIVLIGHGTGKSSAVDYLVQYLKEEHPDVSARVIATEAVDLSALSQPETEAIAKRHMISVVQAVA